MPLPCSVACPVSFRDPLPFPKTAANMAALRNDFLHPIARLSASSGDPGSDLLRHLSPRRFASQRTCPPASQGAGYHRESKPRREYKAGRSFSFARTTRLTEKGRTMSRSRDWLLSPARLSRRRHCRRGYPPLSWPALSPVGVVRDAQSCPCAIFPAARAYPRCHSAFLEVLFRPQGKRAFRSHRPFLAARVFRSPRPGSVLSSKNHAVHSGQSQKSRAAQLALGRSPFLAHFVPLASGRRLSLSFMSQRHFVPPFLCIS